MGLGDIIKGETHKKGWGEELWIVNKEGLYCGKKLFLQQGKRGSLHYHEEKDETFFIAGGKVLLDTYPNAKIRKGDEIPKKEDLGERKTVEMNPGDIMDIPPCLPHQFLGLTESIIIEFSTYHKESDTYRIEKGD